MSATIMAPAPPPGRREHEPITFTVEGDLQEPLRWATTDTGERVVLQRLARQSTGGRTSFASCVSFEQRLGLTLGEPLPDGEAALAGIRVLPGREIDGFVRL